MNNAARGAVNLAKVMGILIGSLLTVGIIIIISPALVAIAAIAIPIMLAIYLIYGSCWGVGWLENLYKKYKSIPREERKINKLKKQRDKLLKKRNKQKKGA